MVKLPRKCDPNIHMELFPNIVLCGGTAMIPGFAERIQKELMMSAPSAVKIAVDASRDRLYTVWTGASILCSMDAFKEMSMWISAKDYDEFGPTIVHRKCQC